MSATIEALREQGVTDFRSSPHADLVQGFDVWPSAAPYRQAFGVLSAARANGYGAPQPIAYSEIVAYAKATGFAETITELEEFVMFIQAQDGAFLDESAKRAEEARRRAGRN